VSPLLGGHTVRKAMGPGPEPCAKPDLQCTVSDLSLLIILITALASYIFVTSK